jgi:hypothetical protein
VTQRARLDRTRQQDLIPEKLFKGTAVTIIGLGGIGGPVALALGKMGVETLCLFDEDGVNGHNIPNQFYRKQDIGQFKTDAARAIIEQFTDARVIPYTKMYEHDPLTETTVVCTDSMASRKAVWAQFLAQKQAHHIIEARMGAKIGMIYTFSKENRGHGRWSIRTTDANFYLQRLYDDDKVKPLPCTARAIIYNTFMISSLMCRAYESILKKEERFPREMIFNLAHMDERTWMFSR